MNRERAETKVWAAQRANPDWRYWLNYDEQNGWQVYGEPIAGIETGTAETVKQGSVPKG